MAEIGLQGACVGSLVGELKAAGMPQHVRMSHKTELGRDAQARHHLAPASGRVTAAGVTMLFPQRDPSQEQANASEVQ
jgi:hypothetical protein